MGEVLSHHSKLGFEELELEQAPIGEVEVPLKSDSGTVEEWDLPTTVQHFC